jgi:hypothetical protein
MLSAPVFGEFQCEEVDFIFPPALEPKKVVNVVHSPSEGTCQPEGQIFKVSVLAITPVLNIPFAAYQL